MFKLPRQPPSCLAHRRRLGESILTIAHARHHPDPGQIKTIQHASVLYDRAATTDCYRGKSRADFDTLHQSMNEFRAVDRSDQHSAEIEQAGSSAAAAASAIDGVAAGAAQAEQSVLLNEFLAEVGSNLSEQGPWSQWWPWTEETSLP